MKQTEKTIIYQNVSRQNSLRREAQRTINILNRNLEIINNKFPFFATPELTIILSTPNHQKDGYFEEVEKLCKEKSNIPYISRDYVLGLIEEANKQIFGYYIEERFKREERGFLTYAYSYDRDFAEKFLEYDIEHKTFKTNEAFEKYLETFIYYCQNEAEEKALKEINKLKALEDKISNIPLFMDIIKIPDGEKFVRFVRYLAKS